MPRGGARPGAGRKPGAANKKTREIADRAMTEGITPLEVMLEDMRRLYAANDLAGAADRARDAAPYMHAKLATTDVNLSGEVAQRAVSDEPLTDAEWETAYGDNLAPTGGASKSTH